MKRLFPIVIVALTVSVATSAQTPPDVSDLVGARGAGGETQLEARGYHQVTTNVVRDTVWSFWWNDRRHHCISVATSDGRYNAINVVPAANCDAASADAQTPRITYDDRGRGERIDLICVGSGSTLATQSNSGYSYNSETRKYEPQYGTTLGREGFSSDVELQVSAGAGRIHPTGKLVSPIHSGGVDGWWPIDNLMVTPERITGGYRMNGLNKPRIDYDRRTRVIHIRAETDFTARCDEQ